MRLGINAQIEVDRRVAIVTPVFDDGAGEDSPVEDSSGISIRKKSFPGRLRWDGQSVVAA